MEAHPQIGERLPRGLVHARVLRLGLWAQLLHTMAAEPPQALDWKCQRSHSRVGAPAQLPPPVVSIWARERAHTPTIWERGGRGVGPSVDRVESKGAAASDGSSSRPKLLARELWSAAHLPTLGIWPWPSPSVPLQSSAGSARQGPGPQIQPAQHSSPHLPCSGSSSRSPWAAPNSVLLPRAFQVRPQPQALLPQFLKLCPH